MKTDEFPLDDLFRSARQQPPLVEVQEVHRLLSGAPLAAAAAANGLAGAKSAVGAKGAVVAKTAGLTSQSIAMLSTVISTAILGSGLWLQHVYVQSDKATAAAPASGQALTELPFTLGQSETPDEGDKDKKKKKKARQKTGITYSFPGGSPLPSAVPEAPEKGAAAPNALAPAAAPVPAVAPLPFTPALAPFAPNEPTRPVAPARAPVPTRPSAPLAPVRAPLPGREPIPAPDRPVQPMREPVPGRKPVEGVRGVEGTRGVAGVPGRAGKAGSGNPCGTKLHSYYWVETKKSEFLNTQAIPAGRYLRLSTKELKDLGITVTDASVEYQRFISQMCPGKTEPASVNTGKNGNALLGTMLEIRYSGTSHIHLTNDKALLQLKPDEDASDYTLHPWFVTEANGRQRVIFKMFHEPEEKLEKDYFYRVQHQLVPVLIESEHGLEGRIVFWFPISPQLLEALPENVSQALEQQYATELATLAKPAAGAETPATSDAVEKSQPAATSNLSSARQLEAYPNPAQNFINLNATFVKADRLRIELHDVKGRAIKVLQKEQPVKEGAWSQNFFFEDVQAGTYLLVVKSETGEQWSQKLVVHE